MAGKKGAKEFAESGNPIQRRSAENGAERVTKARKRKGKAILPSALRAFYLEFAEEPGAGVCPVIVGGAGGDAEDFGGFFEGQTYEVTEFHQFGFELVLSGKFIGSVVNQNRSYSQKITLVAISVL
jgi:hypothetical protein